MSELPKLVRDGIPEIIEDDGEYPDFRVASDEEVDEWVRRKVLEEAEEFAEDGEIEELADLYAVIQRYMEVEDISLKQLEELEKGKSEERGGFKENIILEEVK
jgi:predicted house-cleaning noncanonical NTP pyrophosphatase (MazG superfamily)